MAFVKMQMKTQLYILNASEERRLLDLALNGPQKTRSEMGEDREQFNLVGQITYEWKRIFKLTSKTFHISKHFTENPNSDCAPS